MISFDTNVLFSALVADAYGHKESRGLLELYSQDERVMICELVLLEVYTLLRNPAVCVKPLSGKAAVDAVQVFRRNPQWRVVDYVPDIADALWKKAATIEARSTVYDARIALTLRHHGVMEFATRNVKDFQGYGFHRVWDPWS